MVVGLGLGARTSWHAEKTGGSDEHVSTAPGSGPRLGRLPIRLATLFFLLVTWASLSPARAQGPRQVLPASLLPQPSLPPRDIQAQRFLAHRGVRAGSRLAPRAAPALSGPSSLLQTSSAPAWQPLGPTGVVSAHYGTVTGRISSVALDPADATGNRVYIGTTGGGVWFSQNAAASDPTRIVFTPLTDTVGALNGAVDPSISIGAVSVQPEGTGVVLAGTGDPNDILDSYYGAGILRSTDGGNTWTLIQLTADQQFAFVGEGFAGFAWSTTNPQLVVAAVSQSWEGVLVGADFPNRSYEGLYYSTDAGATWSLARISDPTSDPNQSNWPDVQGPQDPFTSPDGNAATSVVWNPFRNLFIAAVRFHGYYQSPDGVQWTRLSAQPGSNLTAAKCPTNPTSPGSMGCSMYRGTLAVNPATGDTFAWTVDAYDQDQGIWQDVCAASGNSCTNTTIAFATQLNTAAFETNTLLGPATIQNGNYDLALAAIPSGQDTILFAGANDLWMCSLAMSCSWRNTTNSTTCMSAQVAEYQHALAWNLANPEELFIGNDGGLWRSTDGINETGTPVCSSSDATHFQNLNGGLGSLAEVESMSQIGVSSYTMMLGLGANGTAGVASTTGPTTDWPEILSGEGGPVMIDPANPANWYVNNGDGVSIHVCSKGGSCTPSDFGSSPVVSNTNVSGDGSTMSFPAPFLVDPVDPTQLLIGTCRLWRGPATGTGWTTANAIAPMFDGNQNASYCNGNALIRSMAAVALPNHGGEVVYVGTYGSLDGGATKPGHVLSTTMNAGGAWSPWVDLTLNPVTNDTVAMNFYGFDISSLFIDPHDPTANTVYATVAGMPNSLQNVCMVYRSTDGGAHWANLRSNLSSSPGNSLVIDPQDANTAYVALDLGVYMTRNIASCANAASECWAPYGSGLPLSPVVALSAAPSTTTPNVLAAATYGRGVWQIPLVTAGIQPTTATIAPSPLDFGSQPEFAVSAIQNVTLANTGAVTLAPTGKTISGADAGDFNVVTDTCTGAQISEGDSCTIGVVFTPGGLNSRSATLAISANLAGSGSISVTLQGNGTQPESVTASPTVLDFDQDLKPPGPTPVGMTSQPLEVTLGNSNTSAVAISSISASKPFAIAGNACGNSIPGGPGGGSCQLTVTFTPTQPGKVTQQLQVVDAVGTQTVILTGTGAAPPTDTLSATSLSFPDTTIGQSSAAQAITLTNSGDLPLTSVAMSVTGPFQVSSNCTTQLAPHSNCSISVVFTPTQPGSQTGTLTVTDITRSAPQSVALSGEGLLPPAGTSVQIVPAQVSFPTTGVGVASKPVTLTVMNSNAGAALTGLRLSVSSGFQLATNQCGQSLPSGGTCTAGVSFVPGNTGPQAGTFTVSSSALPSAVTAHLSGTGFDFQVTVSGASSQTVAGGQTANYSLTIVPGAGLAGSFTFQCGTLPQYAACRFNPSTESVAAGTTGTEIVQVSTGQTNSGQMQPATHSAWRVASLVLGIFLLPLFRRRRNLLVSVAALVFLGFGFAGCSSSGGGTAGGSPPTSTSPTTAAGTYSIPVTVSASGLQRQVTLVLVVD